MKTIDKNKFETKILLNKAIKEQKINKEDFEFIIKHILKSNLLLVKHYKLFKDFTGNMRDRLNVLLSKNTFINDKILILWFARTLNHIAEDNYEYIEKELRTYLKEKNDKIKDTWNNTYRNKLYDSEIIYSEDNCFKNYLPLKSSIYYDNSFEEEIEKYSIFDNELGKGVCGVPTLTNDEKENLNNLKFTTVNKDLLISDINRAYDIINNNEYKTSNQLVNKVLSMINKFNNNHISVNYQYELEYILDRNKFRLYDMLKEDKFNYNVNDNFIIRDIHENGYSTWVKTINDISEYINIDEWIQYMESHDITSIRQL